MEQDWKQEAKTTLEAEYRWILQSEAMRVLKDVKEILIECSRKFPLHLTIENEPGYENLVKPDKFIMSQVGDSGAANIKGMVTLMGDNVCEADLNLKVPAQGHKGHSTVIKTTIQPDNCWKLQQLQDAGNYLSKALSEVNQRLEVGPFTSGIQAIQLMDQLINSLSSGRSCIVIPKLKTINEVLGTLNKKSLNPALPAEVAISFYVHATKLVLALYHVSCLPNRKFEITDRYQAEVSVPWFSDVIVMFTAALQQCQQLKDKVAVFSQYPDKPADILQPTSEDSINPPNTDSDQILLV